MSENDFDFERCEEVANLLKSLAHPTRLMLLCLLVEKPRTVSELTELTQSSQSGVSQFLNRMKLQGILETEREAQKVIYRIADPNILKLMQSLHSIYCPNH